MSIATVNPATGETLRTFEAMDGEEIERRLQLAEATFRTYRTTSFAERAQRMRRARVPARVQARERGPRRP